MAEAMVAGYTVYDHGLMKRELCFRFDLMGKGTAATLFNKSGSSGQKLHGIATHTNVHISELLRN